MGDARRAPLMPVWHGLVCSSAPVAFPTRLWALVARPSFSPSAPHPRSFCPSPPVGQMQTGPCTAAWDGVRSQLCPSQLSSLTHWQQQEPGAGGAPPCPALRPQPTLARGAGPGRLYLPIAWRTLAARTLGWQPLSDPTLSRAPGRFVILSMLAPSELSARAAACSDTAGHG